MVAGGQAVQAKPALDKFMAEYAKTKAGAMAQALAESLIAVGKPAPSAWQVENWYQGSPADLASPGATVVVFWETWCPHCRKALPVLQTVYDRYRGKGLGVVGFTRLSRGTTDQSVKDFVSENKIRFAMAKESGALSSYFGVNGIPSAAVIKDGMVIWSGHPAAINDGMLQAWLADTAS
jgi:thiol-disulfide isomerase/thioredoxin